MFTNIGSFTSMGPLMLFESAKFIKFAPTTFKLAGEILGLHLMNSWMGAQTMWGQEQLVTTLIWAPEKNNIKVLKDITEDKRISLYSNIKHLTVINSCEM